MNKETAPLSDFISSDDMLLEDEGTSLIRDTGEMENVSYIKRCCCSV